MRVLGRLFGYLAPYKGTLLLSGVLLLLRAGIELTPPLFHKRAILVDPRILILDEATFSVDAEAEYLIQRALESVLQGRTSLVIAHRLSTIRHADKIIALEQGRILQVGDHQERMQRGGLYSQLYRRQVELAATDLPGSHHEL